MFDPIRCSTTTDGTIVSKIEYSSFSIDYIVLIFSNIISLFGHLKQTYQLIEYFLLLLCMPTTDTKTTLPMYICVSESSSNTKRLSARGICWSSSGITRYEEIKSSCRLFERDWHVAKRAFAYGRSNGSGNK